MSTLHTVNKSPFQTQTLVSCLNHCKDGDAVLMIEDGVYGGMAGTGLSDLVAAKAGSVTLHVLTPDLDARGIDNSKLLDAVECVDYNGFVELVAKHDLTHSWL